LLSGAADAAVTDTLEAPSWQEGTSGLRLLGPFTRDWKAYWLPASATERARDLDAWLLAREADGRLAALRTRYLPEPARAPSATVLVALAAAIEERLVLMPLVAEAKRATGTPIRVPAQEQTVVERALASVHEAAARDGLTPPADDAVRDFFAVLIEAAREVQEATPLEPAPEAAPAELEQVLRPALARVSERMAWLLVRLPRSLDDAALEDVLESIQQPGVAPATKSRIGAALRRLCAGRRG
jgi:cyclohexadienyl dehydratase